MPTVHAIVVPELPERDIVAARVADEPDGEVILRHLRLQPAELVQHFRAVRVLSAQRLAQHLAHNLPAALLFCQAAPGR